jgi:hypothetical protein
LDIKQTILDEKLLTNHSNIIRIKYNFGAQQQNSNLEKLRKFLFLLFLGEKQKPQLFQICL